VPPPWLLARGATLILDRPEGIASQRVHLLTNRQLATRIDIYTKEPTAACVTPLAVGRTGISEFSEARPA
jgi:hypothetical protein